MRTFFERAVDNVVRHGDTDIFPYPVENTAYGEMRDDVVDLLVEISDNFSTAFEQYPPAAERALTVVGYDGFRWGTQIEPLWNAYLLGIVLAIAAEIEEQRISKDKRIIFSYRYEFDEERKTLFAADQGWSAFQEESTRRASESPYVLVCDIADFYPRIYHHRLENALDRSTDRTDIVYQVNTLIKHLSNNVSYGLPVGGPAARILSELVLNRVDRLLYTDGVSFCRFSDDYRIFVQTREEAYDKLLTLSQYLMDNEGLALQKAKTRIMSSEEFRKHISPATEEVDPEDPDAEAKEFLSIRLHFDPYSPTAEEDYRALAEEVHKFDILGLLSSEVRKSRIHPSFVRKLIRALRYMDERAQEGAAITLVENLATVYPVFPAVALLLKAVIGNLEAEAADKVFGHFRSLLRNGSYITRVPVNRGFAVRVLADDTSDEADEVLARLFDAETNPLIRRDIIYAMAKRNADYWLSNQKIRFNTSSSWERTALLVSSYVLGDEGSHWRKKMKRHVGKADKLLLAWAAQRKQDGWDIPL